MSRKLVLCCLIVLTVAASASPCRAQNTPKNGQIFSRDARARIADANKNGRRVIVKLQNGSTVSGVVMSASEETFSVMHTPELFGHRKTETLSYSDVVSVRGRNPVMKKLKSIGACALGLPIAALTIPVCQVSILLKHPVLCPCYSGLP
jgi:small nuclear ribonucleoprotein (snRNP)-like protein